MISNFQQELQEAIADLFVFTQQEDCIRVETPFLYPDRDKIDLYLKDNLITDLRGLYNWTTYNEYCHNHMYESILGSAECFNLVVEFDTGELQINLNKINELKTGQLIFYFGQLIARASSLTALMNEC